MWRCALVVAVWLALAPPSFAGGPTMLLGATEDAVRSSSLVTTKAQMDLLAFAGFRAVRISQVWTPGQTEVSDRDRTVLQNVFAAAKLDAITVVTSVVNAGSRTTPLSDQDQQDFAAYAASLVQAVPNLRTLIVGNEPNLNRYWLPQFNDDGTDAAAPAYESLLARTYDAVKAAAPDAVVIGGAVSPRGGDVAGTVRPTHSPTAFIDDMGKAYQASGRLTPIMDGFAIHPYEDNSSIAPLNGMHPNTTTIALADYDKLVSELTAAFGDANLPIYYDEFGVETQIPAAKASLYSGTEVAATHPVPPATQADYYDQAVQLAFCQPNVRGLFLFHAEDEPGLAQWQSGVYYADGTPKPSLAGVKLTLAEARRGVVAHCDGLFLTVHPKVTQKGPLVTLTCDLDCSFVAQLYRLPGQLLVSKRGRAVGGVPTVLPLQVPTTTARYRLRLATVAPVNPGPTTLKLVPLRHG